MNLALSPIFNGYQSFLPTGAPNSGGLIYTYLAGSTTPTATYFDSAGAVAQANPIPLDSGGRPPGEIWINPSLGYKFVLTDTYFNVIGTYDNIVANSALSGGTMTNALNEAPPVTIASATTVAIGAAAANTINISGSTTIVAFDTIAAGAKRTLIWGGNAQLTYNATSMQLIGGVNRVNGVGDISEFESLGSGNWKEINYIPASGWSQNGIAAAKNGLSIQTTSSTALTVTCQQISLQSSKNYLTLTGVNLSASIGGTVGANGLDVGSWAYSTWYAIYLIYNPNTFTSALLFSASYYPSGPTLPSGYTYFARIGWFKTASGSVIFNNQFNQKNSKVILKQPALLTSGVAGDVNVPTWAVISPLVPPTAISQIVLASNQTTSGTAIIMAAPSNSYGAQNSTSYPAPILHTGGSGYSQANIMATLMLESSSIFYASNTASGYLFAAGWEDNF